MAGIFKGTVTRGTVADRLGGIAVQTSGYGRCIPVVYGKARVAANLVYYANFTAVPHSETQRTGKGGGGGRVTNTTYSYTADVILAICEGPVTLGAIWVDKDKLPAGQGLPKLGLTFKAGDPGQPPWAGALSDRKVGYGSTAYVARQRMDLGESATLQNHSFEVVGFHSGANAAGDASPADVLLDMLTNPVHGMGFPAASIAPLDDYRLYAREAGFLVSGAFEGQKQGVEAVKTLLDCTNSIPIWSGGKLRILPLGDLPVGEWEPNSTPLYALGHDDFLMDGPDGDPVEVTRRSATDAYNSVKVKFTDRGAPSDPTYADGVAEANDLAMQDMHGLRPASDFTADLIASADTAQTLAQTLLQRYVGVRNEYKFRLGWRYTLLEPGDLVTLTEPGLGLSNTPVRIVAIEEDSGGDLTVTAEDWPNGVATAVAYPPPPRDGEGLDTLTPPGDCAPPVIFEPPGDLSGGTLQAMVGTSGGPDWGGCEIWASRGGDSYGLIGRISAPARHGTLTANLPSYGGVNPDRTSALSVDISASGGTLLDATVQDAEKWETLCYVSGPGGGEVLSYRDATLTAPGRYTLRYLRRGLFSTPAAAHAVGQKFMRLDAAVATIDLSRWNAGETVHLKFPSFNRFGLAPQGLEDVQAVQYRVAGTGLKTWAAPSAVAIAISDTTPALPAI